MRFGRLPGRPSRIPGKSGSAVALTLAVSAGACLLPAWPAPALAADTVAAENPLILAARTNDANGVRRALARGIDPNFMTATEGPPLVAAAAMESWEAVEALMAAPGIDLQRASAKGETLMMLAAMRGRADLVNRLIARDVDVNREGWTPLHYAVAGGQTDMVKLLLEHSAYIDATSPNGTTPLMLAVRQQQVSIAELLIAEGADPTPRNQSGFAAADYAERNRDPVRAQWLRAQASAFEARYGKPAGSGSAAAAPPPKPSQAPPPEDITLPPGARQY